MAPRNPPRLAAVLVAAVVALGGRSAVASDVAQRRYAVVVGVNTSLDEGVAPLKYADDDAAKYARLFASFVDKVWLLTVFDVDSRDLYRDLAASSRLPDRAGLTRALDEVGAQVAQDRARGLPAAVYFVYTGHGARAKDGMGYVNLTDARLTRGEFHQLLLAHDNTSTWGRADLLHVFVDACSAYFLVRDRGQADLKPEEEGYDEHLGMLFGPKGSDRYPFAGFMLATTGDNKVHEWEAYRGGVFSHLIRSGLAGAADVDLDGKVTYAELGAFVAAASGEIRDPRARIAVTVIPPPASLDAALTERDRFRPRQLVVFDDGSEGRFVIEGEGGERVVDMNKPRGQPAVVALWGGQRFFLQSERGESRLDYSGRTVIAAATLPFGAARRAERGAVDEEFRRALFSRPFDLAFFRAYCALMRLAPPSIDRPALPEFLFEGQGFVSRASPARPVAGRTWVTFGGAVVLAAAAGSSFALASGAASRSDRAEQQGFSALGAGTAIGAGIATVVGLSFLALDLSGVRATLAPTANGAGVTLGSSF